jgi:hypothetical protein
MDHMDDDRIPETQPSGALVPPPRVPPTAVATAAPLPPRRPIPPRPPASLGASLRGFLSAALDRLDALGDRIADAAGLR